MKDNKPWYEKVSIWITIIAGICAILAFIINLCTTTNNINEASANIKEDDSNISNNNQVIGNNNINFNGIFNGDININENKTPETKISSEFSTVESEITNQFNFGQAMQHIYSNEEILQKEIINNKKKQTNKFFNLSRS